MLKSFQEEHWYLIKPTICLVITYWCKLFVILSCETFSCICDGSSWNPNYGFGDYMCACNKLSTMQDPFQICVLFALKLKAYNPSLQFPIPRLGKGGQLVLDLWKSALKTFDILTMNSQNSCSWSEKLKMMRDIWYVNINFLRGFKIGGNLYSYINFI